MPIRRSKWYGGGNRSMLANILIYGLLAILSSRLAFAIPNTLTLQGKLTNTAGGVLSGSYTMVFRIYDIPGFSYYNVSNQTGEDNTAIQNITYINYTNILWKDNRTVTTDANGIYDVVLHNLSLLNFSDQYYLGIMVGDDNESIPRINLTSSPYAFRANISEDLNKENRYEVSVLNITGNLTLGTDFDDTLTITTGRLNISDGSIKAAGNLTLAEKITFSLGQVIDNLISGFLRISGKLNVTGNVSIAQDTLFVDNTSGRVGIGTTTPKAPLDVNGNVTIRGNLTVGSNALFVNASGRVGIGTGSPKQELEIVGSLQVTPTNLTLKGFYNSTNLNGASTIYIAGKYAYITSSTGNALNILDISNPSSPAFVGRYQSNANLVGPVKVYVVGKYAYVAVEVSNADGRLTIIDVSDPFNPTFVDSYQDATYLVGPNDVHVSGKYAYINSYYKSSLNIIDISNPFNMTLAGVYANADSVDGLGGGPEPFAIQGKYAYITTFEPSKLVVINISDPSAPTYVTRYNNSDYLYHPLGIYVSGKYAYVTSANNLRNLLILNISDPAKINVTGNYQFAAQYTNPEHVVVKGKYAYVSFPADDSFAIVDVSDPTSPSLVNVYSSSEFINETQYSFVSGKYAYVLGKSGGSLAILDLPGADIPAASIGTISASTLEIADNVNIGHNLYVGEGLSVGPFGIYSQGRAGIFESSPATALTVTQNGVGDILNLFDGLTEVFTVADNGSVGIGTASPNVKLTVIGGINASGGLNVTAGDVLLATESGRVGIGTTAPNDALEVIGNVRISGSLNATSINTTKGAYFATSSGSVGIGTTAPNDALEVVGNARVSGSLNATSINASRLYARNGTAAAPAYTFIDDTDTGIINSGKAGNNISIVTGGSARMTIDNSGNVGIGTTDPDSDNLRIYGDSFLRLLGTGGNFLAMYAPSPPRFVINDAGNSRRWDIRVSDTNAGTGKFSIMDINGGVPADQANRLVIDTSGNIGIGTTSPLSRLHVNDSSAEGALRVTNISGTTLFFVNGSSGNVGIGTTSPNDILEAVGNVRVSGSLNATSINTTKGAYFATSSGSVGIGTTTPFSLLHLNKSDLANTSVTNVLTLDHTNPNGVNLTGGIGVSMLFRASDNASQIYNIGNISAILYNSTNGSQLGALTFSTVGADTGDNSFGHLTERLRIDGYGRVGINTTTPTKTLHVVGDANITGRLDAGKLNITGVSFSQGDLDAAGSLRVAGGTNISGDLGVLGKIGAGTLTPITTLDVKGKANFTGNFSVGETSNIFFVDNTSGNVGIGTASPGYSLTIGTASGGRMISGDVTVTDSSSSIYGAALIMRGSATSASNGNQILGGSLQSILAATNTQSWTATVGMRAVDAKVQMLTGASGTVTGGANFYARTAIDAGTLTNWYGTYIEAPTGAGTITNKYAFVSEAGAGNVGIGNTVPNASLDVTGNIFLSSASPIINVSGPTIRKSGSDIVISD